MLCVCYSAFLIRAPHVTLLGTPPGARILRINRERRNVGSRAQDEDGGDAAVRVSGTSVTVALVYQKHGLF